MTKVAPFKRDDKSSLVPVLEQILRHMDKATYISELELEDVTTIMKMRDNLLTLSKKYGARDRRWR